LDSLDRSPQLFPQDALSMAAYGQVLGLLDGIAVWNRELRRPVHERSSSVIALEEVRAARVADALEKKVAAGGYSDLDVGFLALAAVLGYGERRHTVWQWRKGRPALSTWFETASARPAFKDTLPPPSGI
jgi:glutathione S-transferase